MINSIMYELFVAILVLLLFGNNFIKNFEISGTWMIAFNIGIRKFSRNTVLFALLISTYTEFFHLFLSRLHGVGRSTDSMILSFINCSMWVFYSSRNKKAILQHGCDIGLTDISIRILIWFFFLVILILYNEHFLHQCVIHLTFSLFPYPTNNHNDHHRIKRALTDTCLWIHLRIYKISVDTQNQFLTNNTLN